MATNKINLVPAEISAQEVEMLSSVESFHAASGVKLVPDKEYVVYIAGLRLQHGKKDAARLVLRITFSLEGESGEYNLYIAYPKMGDEFGPYTAGNIKRILDSFGYDPAAYLVDGMDNCGVFHEKYIVDTVLSYSCLKSLLGTTYSAKAKAVEINKETTDEFGMPTKKKEVVLNFLVD